MTAKELYDMTEEQLFNLVISKEPLKNDIISFLISDFEVDTIEGDHGRWTQYMYSVIELCGHYFGINWERGLTEYQENYYPELIFEEVEPREKMIKITEWYPIGEKNNE